MGRCSRPLFDACWFVLQPLLHIWYMEGIDPSCSLVLMHDVYTQGHIRDAS